MYKTAARNLQRRRRPSPVFRLKPQPRSRAQLRVFWFPVIRHHADANISVADKYGPRFPTWLEREVDRLSPAGWLLAWNEKTGRTNRAPKDAGRRLSASPAPAPRGSRAPR